MRQKPHIEILKHILFFVHGVSEIDYQSKTGKFRGLK
jgi:hypothetical protein